MQALAVDSSDAPTLPRSLADRLEPWSLADTLEPAESERRPICSPFETAGASHPGRVRARNEDAYSVFPEIGLCAVADGLGGRRGGEVASSLAIRETQAFLADSPPVSGTEPGEVLAAAVAHANSAVHAAGQADPGLKGMATTFVGLLFSGSRVAIAHAGDSRAYRIRHGRAERLTVDHSMREVYLQMYKERADPEVAERNASIVTRALGATARIQIDVRTETVEPGDVFLLCSDGLWGLMSDEEIAFALAISSSLEAATAKLIATAYNRGGPDNITAVIVRPRSPAAL